jgi:serine/threonine protein kinase
VVSQNNETKTELSAIEAVCRSNPPNEHVIRVYDYWFHRSDLPAKGAKLMAKKRKTYIRMSLCEGTLEEYLAGLTAREESLKPFEITEIMIHILTGLYHCHVQGYCHRDLKLSNGRPF